MKIAWLTFVFAIVAGLSRATAQAPAASQPPQNQPPTTQSVTINTMDRDIVPVVIQSKQTQVDTTTTRTESVSKGKLNDGSYFDWRDTVTTERQVDPNHTEVVQDIQENDRQGGTRTTRQIKKDVTKTAGGQDSKESEFRRNSSGAMVLDRVNSAVTTDHPDGSASTTRTEQAPDVNGTLKPVQQVQESVVPLGATKKQITSQISRPDHLDGTFKVVGRETSTVDTSATGTRTEKIIQEPDGAGWKDTGRVVTTETKLPDGSVSRETIVEGRSLESRSSTPLMNLDSVVPQRKIVEHEVHKADGSVVMQRDVFHRDVNGDWVPQTFSTATPGSGYDH